MKNLFKLFIVIYQKFISPTLRCSCRFYPSCSEYAKVAIDIHGIKAILVIIKRIIRCHPFCEGGYDPVPNRI